MTVVFRESFLRDVRKLRNQSIRDAIDDAIRQIESAKRLADISHFRFLAGHPGYGRVRVREYRLGVIVEQTRVHFVRCLHRREVYRFFP